MSIQVLSIFRSIFPPLSPAMSPADGGEAARQQLRQPEGVERLVLEYAETIDFRRQSRSTAQVEELQRAGVH
jgi:hypothetical protein